MSSSQINSSNFEIWYREGPQKLKILSFSYLDKNFFWIESQSWRQEPHSMKGLLFESYISESKELLFKKLTTTKCKDFQNSIWRPNSTCFSDGKICFLSFWGPSLYQISKFEEFIWLELISAQRSTWFWRLTWNFSYLWLPYPWDTNLAGTRF